MRRFGVWKREHPLLYAAAFAVIYFSWFYLLENFRAPLILIRTGLDELIPFNKYFIIPHSLWFIYIFGTCAWFYLYSRDEYYDLCRYMFTGMLLSLAIYTIIPTGLDLRPEMSQIAGNDPFSAAVRLIYNVDTPTNVCPSLHVFNSIAITVIILRSAAFRHAKAVKWSAIVLTVLICASTVLLKQHSVVDVFWGFVMSMVLYPLSYAQEEDAVPALQRISM